MKQNRLKFSILETATGTYGDATGSNEGCQEEGRKEVHSSLAANQAEWME